MKRVCIAIALALIGLYAHAQENFYVEKGEILWRHVFKNEADLGTIERNFRAKGCFRDFYSYDGIITAELSGLRMDVTGAGYKRMQVPVYLPNGIFSAFVVVQVKEGRYRVTVRRIGYHIERIGDSTLSDIALGEDGKVLDKFVGPPSNIINYTFFNLFSDLGEEEENEW